MRLRVLLILVGLVLALIGITSARAEECVYADECVMIIGTFWIDDDADGIRQPSEKASAFGEAFIIVDSDDSNVIPVNVEDEGRFRYARVYPRASFRLWSYQTVPGHSVYEFRRGGGYTHFGKACFYVPQGSTEITADIRLMHHSVLKGAPPTNWSIHDGRFFKETSGERYRGCDSGFAVTNAGGFALWDTWQRLGLESVGYPISHRFMWRGFVTQAFQKAIVQLRPGRGVVFVNIFDELHEAGKDAELRNRWAIPFHLEFDPVQGWDWDEFVERRLALLDANQAIKERYFATRDPLLRFGLPTSRVEDFGNMFVIRTQKAVFQQWKEDVPWAKAGEVTIANGGDIAKTLNKWLGWFPEDAQIPQHISLVDQGE